MVTIFKIGTVTNSVLCIWGILSLFSQICCSVDIENVGLVAASDTGSLKYD